MTSSLPNRVRLRTSQVLGVITVVIGFWLTLFIDRSGFGVFGIAKRVFVLMLYLGSSIVDFRYFRSERGEGLAPILASSLVLRFLIAGSVYITIGSRNSLSHLPGGIMLTHVLALTVLMAWKFLDDLRDQFGKRR